jgi:hypothetical protein
LPYVKKSIIADRKTGLNLLDECTEKREIKYISEYRDMVKK